MEDRVRGFMGMLELQEVPPSTDNAPYRVGGSARNPGYNWSFSGFHGKDFEALCFSIIKNKFDFCGAQYFVPGSNQYGMDIFAIKNSDSPQKVHAFECKHHDDGGLVGDKAFSIVEIQKAANRFLDRVDIDLFSSFTVIIATELTNEARLELGYLKKKFLKRGIKFDVWSRLHVWDELSKLPIVAERFVRGGECDALLSGYYKHARALAHTWLMAEVDTEAAVAAKISEIARNKEAGIPIIEEHDNVYLWKDGLIHLYGFLPKFGQSSSGCLLTILAPGHDTAVVEIPHDQVIGRIWHSRSVIGEKRDPKFIDGPIGGANDSFCLNFSGVKVFVPQNVAKSASAAFGCFVDRYIECLFEMETAYGAEGFKFKHVSGSLPEILLGSIPKWLWDNMIRFASIYDAGKAPPERLSFDAASGIIKLFTNKSHETLDRGYHAFIKAENYQSGSDRVLLYWYVPDAQLRKPFDKRRQWDCITTFEWMRDEFIPAVVNYRRPKRRLTSFWKKQLPLSAKDAGFIDLRAFDLRTISSGLSIHSTLEAVTFLQSRYSAVPSGSELSFPAKVYREIIRTAAYAAQALKTPYVGYAASNIGVSISDVHDYKEFAAEALRSAKDFDRGTVDPYQIECGLRAIMDILSKAESVGDDVLKGINASISPLIPPALELQLLDRHR